MAFGAFRIPLDALAVLAALLLAYRLRQANIDLIPRVQLLEPASTLPTLPYYLETFALPGVLVFLVLAAMLHLYAIRSTLSAWVEVGRILAATALWLIIIIAWYFLVLKQLFFSRALLVHAAFFIALFVTAGRASLTLLQRSLLRTGLGRYLVVSVGIQQLTHAARDTLEHDLHYQYLGHLQDLEGLKRLEQQRHLDLALQTDPNPGSEATLTLIDYCRSHHIGYGFLPPVLADVPHLLHVDRLGLLPLIRFQPTPLDGWGRIAKRVFDLLVSGVLLVLLSPLFLLIALCIVLDSGMPIFYVSSRMGEHGRRRISVLKFRSMVCGADMRKPDLQAKNIRRDGPLFKVPGDPRVTRMGRGLRRWSLDELPQLWNVLLGHLSLVGPRPHLPEEVERYALRERRVFAVKPGVTGLAQISGRSNLQFGEEVRLDLQYIEEWSLFLDLWILWRTVFVVLSRHGAD